MNTAEIPTTVAVARAEAGCSSWQASTHGLRHGRAALRLDWGLHQGHAWRHPPFCMVTGLDGGGDWMGRSGTGGLDFVWTLMCRDWRSEARAAFGAVEECRPTRVVSISMGERPEVTTGIGGGCKWEEKRVLPSSGPATSACLGCMHARTHGDGLRLWRREGGEQQRRRFCLARGECFFFEAVVGGVCVYVCVRVCVCVCSALGSRLLVKVYSHGYCCPQP